MDVPAPNSGPGASSAPSAAASAAAAAANGAPPHLNWGEDTIEFSTDEERVVVSRMLQEANVTEWDMDPTSLQALREHLCGNAAKPSPLVPSTNDSAGRLGAAVAASSSGGIHGDDANRSRDVAALFPRGRFPDGTRGGGRGPFGRRGPTGTLSHPLTASEAEALYAFKQTNEDRILQRLDEQTKLLQLLHERVTELSNAVSGMDGSRPPRWNENNYDATSAPGRQPAPQGMAWASGDVRPILRGANDVDPARAGAGAGAAGAAAHDAVADAAPPNMVVLPLLGSLMLFVSGMPDRLRNSRPAKIVRLYMALRRRQVPDLDVAMIFKVLVMAAILVGRMGRSHNGAAAPPPRTLRFPPDSSMTFAEFLAEVWRRYRFHVASTLILAGFLVQTGYAKFIYNFFVKEDYPGRIWNGEDLDVEQVLREQQQQQQQQQRVPPQPPGPGQAPPAPQQAPGAAVADADANGPAQPPAPPAGPAADGAREPWPPAAAGAPLGYVVGGRVPRNDDPAGEAAAGDGREPRRRMPAPIRFVVEVGYLLSSFVLSIFPMWQPVAAEEERPRRGDDDDGNNNNNNNNLEGNRGRDDPGQLPRVRPPEDPAAYEDEDENEYDEDDEDGFDSDEE